MISKFEITFHSLVITLPTADGHGCLQCYMLFLKIYNVTGFLQRPRSSAAQSLAAWCLVLVARIG